MRIARRFTKQGQDVYAGIEWSKRTSKISDPNGRVVFEMRDVDMPASWSQLAVDIMVSKYFRRAGVPQLNADGTTQRDAAGEVVLGSETSARQVVGRLAGCWRHWGEQHGYFDTAEDAQAFQDELAWMLLDQMAAPNSPQWFNTGLHWAYGITGPAQGHHYCDPVTGELKLASNAYEHPQPHACFIQAVRDDLVGPGGIMDLWTREARLFKYGSGTGTNYSKVRGENEPLSGGGKSSGLMSFLKIGDRAAGAIKSGGTTRRAAKMVCLDLDHPDIEEFVNWKVREELKVAALVEGLKVLPADQRELAASLGLKLDYDFNGESYLTVSGQNSNNSVRISNAFFRAVDRDDDWTLVRRSDGKVHKKIKARKLWDEICFAAWRCADPGVQFDTTINQWHTCPASGPINASNPCVVGETRVLTPGGIWRRMDEMIHLPSRVCTNLGAHAIGVTQGSFPTGTKEVLELTTDGGYRLTLTPDHRVWTGNRGWVEAKSLTSDDYVTLASRPACVQEVGEPVDAALFQLAGLLVSDANASADEIELTRALAGDDANVERFAQYAQDGWTGNGADANVATLTTALASRRLLSRLTAFTKRDGAGTRLSDDAFTAGLAAQKHLLRGLFAADGDVVHSHVALGHRSPALLEDVQLLLLGFGVQSARRGNALVVADASLPLFAEHVGFLANSPKRARLDDLLADLPAAPPRAPGNFDRVAALRPLGERPVYDLCEPQTSSFVANGLTVHNCSEYMFLDDTACNLASLNVMRFFDGKARAFDLDAYKHATRLWTVVLEISVLMASFPSERIAELSYRYRTLGLGYANLGAMLMQCGIPYDSEQGRAVCAALTAVLTGESYATSAEMAREHGPFPGFADNRDHVLRVMRNHRRAAFDVAHDLAAASAHGGYDGLDLPPVGVDASQFGKAGETLLTNDLLVAARECWDRALAQGEQHGFRNAQTTVIAPTGTIGLLMDCDTTGVEPDFALVKFKKLAGGGYFKIANASLKPALLNLGYTAEQTTAILRYVMGTLTLADAPHVNRESLRAKGFTDADLKKIDDALPATFELPFAFSGWALGAELMTKLGFTEAQWQAPTFNLLRALGFTKQQIAEASDVICGRGTVENAPHLRAEHFPVFDCANKCGKLGTRYIAADGHIRMMAAAQPFISGAISKTINLPHEATLADIAAAYRLSWELGLKANALYRDGSKLSQPLNVKSDADEEDDDEANADAGRDAVATDVAKAAVQAGKALGTGELAANVERVGEHDVRVIERVVERVVNRPMRRRLADTRQAVTHKFDVAGHEGYITVGLYDDGAPGEMFVTMAKEGSTIGGLMDTVATLVSVALQYGVPLESLVRKFEHVRFEPNGMTRNADIPFAKSLVDYIFRWLAMEFVPGYAAVNSPKRQYEAEQRATLEVAAPPEPKPAAPRRLAEQPVAAGRVGALDALSAQGASMQSDAPACTTCGSITVRSGTCYKCLNCGASLGCS